MDIYFLNKSKNILLKIFTVSWKKSEVSLKNTEKSLKTNMSRTYTKAEPMKKKKLVNRN